MLFSRVNSNVRSSDSPITVPNSCNHCEKYFTRGEKIFFQTVKLMRALENLSSAEKLEFHSVRKPLQNNSVKSYIFRHFYLFISPCQKTFIFLTPFKAA